MDNARKIRLVSQLVQYGCYLFLLLAVVVVAAMLYQVLFRPDLLQLYMTRDFQEMFAAVRAVQFWRGIPATLLLFAPAPLLMFATWRLSQLMQLFKDQHFFTEEAARLLFLFALGWLLFHLLPLPLVFIASALLSLGTDFDVLGISLFINGDELPMLVASLSFMVIAWVLRESVIIARENEAFV